MMLTFMINPQEPRTNFQEPRPNFQESPRVWDLVLGFWSLEFGLMLSLKAGQRRHHLIGDRLHHFLQVGGFRGPGMAILFFWVKSVRFGNEFAVAALKDAVAAQVAVFAAKARIVVTEPFLD